MKKLITFFVNNKILVNLITWGLIIGSAFIAIGIKQDLFPDSDSDAMMISVVYPGASAKDVEINITIPLEDKLKTISGIDEYFSSSTENTCRLFVKIDENLKNTQKVKNEIREKITGISGLPSEAGDVEVTDLSSEYMSVYEIGLSLTKESKLTEYNLLAYADRLEDELLKLSNVSDVSIEGDRDKEVKISVDPKKMTDYDISLTNITNSIKTQNIRLAGGTMKASTGTHDVVTNGQFNDPLEVKDVIIRSNFDQEHVMVKDVAEVSYDLSEEKVISRINGNKGVYLRVKKKAESDIVKTAVEVKNFVEETKKNIPEGLDIISISDESKTITSLMNVVQTNALIGFLLVFLMLLIFLENFRVSFWVAFCIPLVTLITLAIMHYLDFTLNIMTLGTIAMLLGILVDDGIVISEIIVKNKSRGMSFVDAVYTGLKEVTAPIFVSVFTTIVAFLPLLSIQGMMGKFIFVLPIIVVITLTVSLFEAIFLLPAHLVAGKEGPVKKQNDKNKKNWFNKLEGIYKNFLKKVLQYKYLVIFFFIGVFVVTILITGGSAKRFRLMNDNVSDTIKTAIVLDEKLGTTIYKTAGYIDIIEKEIRKYLSDTELLSIQSSVGHSQSNDMSLSGYHTNVAVITINLSPETERERKAEEIMQELRKNINTDIFKEFTEITFKKIVRGPDAGNAVDIKLLSSNDDETKKVIKEVKEYLATIDDIVNIEDNLETARSELTVKFDYKKMAMLGVDVDTVANTVRTAFYGTVATTMLQGTEELNFRVIVSEDSQIAKNENYLLNLLVPNSTSKLIKLKDFAYIEYNKAVYSIIHENGYRVFEITADIANGSQMIGNPPDKKTVKNDSKDKKIPITSLQINDMIQKEFAEKIKQNPHVDMRAGGEAERSKEALGGLGLAFLMTVALIYFTMVILFKNFSQPLLIMLSIPFGIVGALLAFLAHGVSVDFFEIVGIIGLSGIVVNDCIVMVDFLNKHSVNNSDDKSKLIDNIAEGAKERLRAIILTTVTTSAGLLPTVYGIGGSSPFVTPIALAIAYGLLFASLVTLFFMPSIYLIRIDLINISGLIKGKIKEIFLKRKSEVNEN